jgi:hypothetical protein
MHFRHIDLAIIGGAALTLASPAMAHCDGIDGPVVGAARTALESDDPNPVLIWVQPKDEAEVRTAFADAVSVRKLGPKARDMADRYFFETLVRLHRAGEGAPYTGLKPAGRDLGPAIPLADKAVATGSDREVADFVAENAAKGVHAHFAEVHHKRDFRPDDLGAGRDYVASYVRWVHYVEGLQQAIESQAAGHYDEGGVTPSALDH